MKKNITIMKFEQSVSLANKHVLARQEREREREMRLDERK